VHVVATDELHLMKLPRRPVLELARRHPRVTLSLLKDLGPRLQPAARQAPARANAPRSVLVMCMAKSVCDRDATKGIITS
jgi:hypothetical protein